MSHITTLCLFLIPGLTENILLSRCAIFPPLTQRNMASHGPRHTSLPKAHCAQLTGCPEPGLEQKMVYFRMIPLGLVGGSQETTTLLEEEGTALIPAGGPGTG